MYLSRSRTYFSLYPYTLRFITQPKFAARLSGPTTTSYPGHFTRSAEVTQITKNHFSTSSVPTSSTATGRNLILCFDGTGHRYGASTTNIVKLYSTFEKDSETQMTYYQPGIGAYAAPGFWDRPTHPFHRKLDKALAINLESHICGGYWFLQENYRHGDRIYLFGFSRGAYIARALAGMINKVGLLGADNTEQVHYAYKLYRDRANFQLCNGFKRTFSRDVSIEFLGCWDTVSSVGYLSPTLAYTKSNRIVKTFRHALALDERRSKFQPSYWQDQEVAEDVIIDAYSYGNIFSHMWRWISTRLGFTKTSPSDEWERMHVRRKMGRPSDSHLPNTDAVEVWFAGSHCDVGGGSVPNDELHSLSNPSLRWMINELISKCPEVQFKLDDFALVTLGLQEPSSDHLDYNFESTPKSDKKSEAYIEMQQSIRTQPFRPTALTQLAAGTIPDRDSTTHEKARSILHFREHCEISDVISPVHDRLEAWGWWILEYIPRARYRVVKLKDDQDNKFKCYLRRVWVINNSQSRLVPKRKNHYFHYTVQQRLSCKALGYKYKARFEHDGPFEPQFVYDASPNLENPSRGTQ